MLEVLAPSGLTASRILLVGLGKPEALDEKGLETIGAQIVAKLQSLGETAGNLRNRSAQGRESQKWRDCGASGLWRPAAQLRLRQIPHQESR